MSEAPPTPCRWFQFGLVRMLVVVALFAGFLTYQVNWILERHRLLAEQELSPQRGVYVGEDAVEPPSAPGLLWLFGERGLYSLDLAVVSPDVEDLMEEDAERLGEARRLYPEAIIGAVRVGPDGI